LGARKIGHTLVIELRDEDYAALLAEARRFGVAPERVAVARLSGVTPVSQSLIDERR
jgi:hypothetical protein